MLSVLTIRGEEIAAENLYFDQMEFLTQLGLAPVRA
jgi:hypothetical protein